MYVVQNTSIEAIISLLVRTYSHDQRTYLVLPTLVLCIINQIVQRTFCICGFFRHAKEKFFATPYVALHSDTSGDHVNANPKNLLSTEYSKHDLCGRSVRRMVLGFGGLSTVYTHSRLDAMRCNTM
jgi:hypothetical protein